MVCVLITRTKNIIMLHSRGPCSAEFTTGAKIGVLSLSSLDGFAPTAGEESRPDAQDDLFEVGMSSKERANAQEND